MGDRPRSYLLVIASGGRHEVGRMYPVETAAVALEGRIMQPDDVFDIGDTTFKLIGDDRAELAPHVVIEATPGIDPLTGLMNRRAFVERLDAELAHAAGDRGALSLVVLDVDRMKNINNLHGHVVGDRVLLQLADVVARATRREHVLARTDGDELSLLLAGIELDPAARLGAELAAAVARTAFTFEDTPIALAVSVGCASARPPEPALDLLERACDALHAARRARGR